MPVTIRYQSVDDDPTEKTFPSLDEAIAFAVQWFIDGYANDAIDTETRAKVESEYVPMLRRDLTNGDSFHCGYFHETVEIVSG